MGSPRRRDSESSDDDDQPQTSKGRNSEGQFLHFDINTNDFKPVRSEFVAGQRRRRRFTPARRKEVAAVRKAGACDECRKKHIACVHALKGAALRKSANSHSPPENSPDASHPSSLTSSVSTNDGILQLEHLNEYIPPIKRYLHSYDEDPPSAWISDASWTSDSNRDPAAESVRCLSPKLEQLSNIIEGAQSSKNAKLQQYIPANGSMEPLYVLPARQRLQGENAPYTWDAARNTFRNTPQPRRAGVSKPPRSARGSNRQVTPAMARSVSGQSQMSAHTAPSPAYSYAPTQQTGYVDDPQMYAPQVPTPDPPPSYPAYQSQSQSQPQPQPQPYQTPQQQWQLSAGDLDYDQGNGLMNNLGRDIPQTSTPYAPPWTPGYHTNIPTRYPQATYQPLGFLAPPPMNFVANMAQPTSYDTGGPFQHQAFRDIEFGSPLASGYNTSEPPSLIIEASTAPSGFESSSNYSGSRYPVPQTLPYDTGEDMFASTGSIEDMLRGGSLLDGNNEQAVSAYDATKPHRHGADDVEEFEFLNMEDFNDEDLT